MTDTVECGYGTETGCATCNEYGNDTGTAFTIAAVDEPERGTIVSVPADTVNNDPDALERVYFIRADNEQGLWWEPLEFGFVTWLTLLHEVAPGSPEILDDPEFATYIADLAIYKNRYSMVTCETCEETPMGPAVVDLAKRRRS